MHSIETHASRFGADDVVAALLEHGVDTFFANPGTSEIHLVDAIDRRPDARAVLCLFEGVATGAADGFARVSGRAAAVLLHLGPGLANGLANLHNAAKARSPMIVLVGEHATSHLQFDSPLRSDLDALAQYAAKQVFRLVPGCDIRDVIRCAVETAHAAPRGPVVVVANADVMWSETSPTSINMKRSDATRVSRSDAALDETAELASELRQRGGSTCLLLGGDALTAEAQSIASQISIKTGCRLLIETFNGCQERGVGVPVIERLAYFREAAQLQLKAVDVLALVGSRPPVAFFGSPDEGSVLTAPDTRVVPIDVRTPALGFLKNLAEAVQATGPAAATARRVAEVQTGALSPRTIWNILNRVLPAGTIVSDEAGTTSIGSDAALCEAEPHRVLNLTGGSIGQGLPVATGAAIASPESPVLCVHGDGGAMYTLQSLWTQAREGCRVVNVVFKNERYGILDYEVKRHGLGPLGPRGAAMFDLARPSISWTEIARGMGLDAVSVSTAEQFSEALELGFAEPRPRLIEVCLRKP
jgi:acetolactate synthase I/II/III large subunit